MAIKKYINTADVVELTGRTTNEVLNLAKTGVLPAHKTRRGHWRFNVDAVEKYFGIVINKPIENVDKPQVEDGFAYVADEEHYTQVFKRMTEVKHSLKIATGDLKNFNVSVDSDDGEVKFRLCEFFLSLVKRGVHVQVVCMKPYGFYLNTKENCPQLLENPLFELRENERNHMKVFIFDDECAYFGSANITSAAIGKRTKRNHEAGILVWGADMIQAPLHHFEKVWNNPICLKSTWKRFLKEANKLKKEMDMRFGK